MAYAIGAIRFFLSAIFVRATVVVAWTGTPLEKLLAFAAQIVGTRLIVVVHNPVPERDLTDKLERLVRRYAFRLVVHSEVLTSQLDARKSVVAEHPAYFEWVRKHAAGFQPTMSERGTARQVLFLGALRPDKGMADLPNIDSLVWQSGGVLRLCVGKADTSARLVLARCEHAVQISDGRGYIDDETIYRSLSHADVLIAPYTNVTASGTVLMALTMGVQVATYASRSLAEFLPPAMITRTSTAEELVRIAMDARFERSASLAVALEVDARSVQSWGKVASSGASHRRRWGLRARRD